MKQSYIYMLTTHSFVLGSWPMRRLEKSGVAPEKEGKRLMMLISWCIGRSLAPRLRSSQWFIGSRCCCVALRAFLKREEGRKCRNPKNITQIRSQKNIEAKQSPASKSVSPYCVLGCVRWQDGPQGGDSIEEKNWFEFRLEKRIEIPFWFCDMSKLSMFEHFLSVGNLESKLEWFFKPRTQAKMFSVELPPCSHSGFCSSTP